MYDVCHNKPHVRAHVHSVHRWDCRRGGRDRQVAQGRQVRLAQGSH